MRVQAITVQSFSEPDELNTWFQNNAAVVLHSVVIEGNVFYIFYE